jgi:hypothetical protein
MSAMRSGHTSTISIPHCCHAKVLRDSGCSALVTFRSMMSSESTNTRTLTIVLPESDWRALRTAEPDAIGWIQQRIRERLALPDAPARRYDPPSAATADSWWGDDDY